MCSAEGRKADLPPVSICGSYSRWQRFFYIKVASKTYMDLKVLLATFFCRFRVGNCYSIGIKVSDTSGFIDVVDQLTVYQRIRPDQSFLLFEGRDGLCLSFEVGLRLMFGETRDSVERLDRGHLEAVDNVAGGRGQLGVQQQHRDRRHQPEGGGVHRHRDAG